MNRHLLRASVVASLVLGLAATTACGGGGGGGGGVGPSGNRFDLKGIVRDKANAPLYGATVEVLDGSNAGRSVSTNMDGAYTLTALVQGGFTVKASKRGFVAATQGVTLTSASTTDFTLAQDVPQLSLAFDPPTISVGTSDNPEYPDRLRFILQVREANYVDVTMQAIFYTLTTPDGSVIRWWGDTEELKEDYGSLIVSGGGTRLLNIGLIYDGQPRGTMVVVLQATGPDGAFYTATATAPVVPGPGASASSFGPAVRAKLPER